MPDTSLALSGDTSTPTTKGEPWARKVVLPPGAAQRSRTGPGLAGEQAGDVLAHRLAAGVLDVAVRAGGRRRRLVHLLEGGQGTAGAEILAEAG